MITRAAILQRKETLQHDQEQMIANLNAIVGALQDCDYWLAELDKAERKEQPAEGVTHDQTD